MIVTCLVFPKSECEGYVALILSSVHDSRTQQEWEPHQEWCDQKSDVIIPRCAGVCRAPNVFKTTLFELFLTKKRCRAEVVFWADVATEFGLWCATFTPRDTRRKISANNRFPR